MCPRIIYHKLEKKLWVLKYCLRCELGICRSKYTPFLPIRNLLIVLVLIWHAGSKVVIFWKCEEVAFTRIEDPKLANFFKGLASTTHWEELKHLNCLLCYPSCIAWCFLAVMLAPGLYILGFFKPQPQLLQFQSFLTSLKFWQKISVPTVRFTEFCSSNSFKEKDCYIYIHT